MGEHVSDPQGMAILNKDNVTALDGETIEVKNADFEGFSLADLVGEFHIGNNDYKITFEEIK